MAIPSQLLNKSGTNQDAALAGQIKVEITSAGPLKSKLFYWLFFNIVLDLPCRGFSSLHLVFLFLLMEFDDLSGRKQRPWTNTASVLLEAELSLILYFVIIVETSVASWAKASRCLPFQRAGRVEAENKDVSVFLKIGALDVCIRRNCLGKACSYPDFSLLGTGRDGVHPSLENFWEAHRAQTSLVFTINPREMSSSAFSGSYVRWKEFQIQMKLYYSAAFIHSKDTLLYRLCMNFSHLQE